MPQNTILLLNGPNLNMLGMRRESKYGTKSLPEIVNLLIPIAQEAGYDLLERQSNHEGGLIDEIHSAIFSEHIRGILLNAGGYTHTSVSIRDALEIAKDRGIPTVEVHLSNIREREPFRHESRFDGVVVGQVMGEKEGSYVIGLKKLIAYLKSPS